jgi:hypothetical protein
MPARLGAVLLFVVADVLIGSDRSAASESWMCDVTFAAAQGQFAGKQMPETLRIAIGDDEIDIAMLRWSSTNSKKERAEFTRTYKILLNNDIGLIAGHPVAEKQSPVRTESVVLDKARGDFEVLSIGASEMQNWLGGTCRRDGEQ